MAPPPIINNSLKPMRRGTRSCRECRRRKIKCSWPSPSPQSSEPSAATTTKCNECNRSSRNCSAQGYTIPFSNTNSSRVNKSESLLNIKVKRIESIVSRLSKLQGDGVIVPQKPDGNRDENGCSFERVQNALVDGQELDEYSKGLGGGLLFGLFNNEVIKQNEDQKPTFRTETSSTIYFGKDSSLSDLEKLQSTIAHDPQILDVVSIASEWWISWRDAQYILKSPSGIAPTVRSFVQDRLNSTDPVVYATGLICIAMSLHRIRPGLDDKDLTLSAPPLQLFDRIVTAIDQVVLSRQPMGAAGILLALQRAKTHAEGDQLRKSWLRIRHAILLCQYMDFANDKTVSSEELVFRQRWVGGIYEMDHHMSLILGFPHARDRGFTDTLAKEALFDTSGTIDLDTKMRALRRCVAVMAGRINRESGKGQTPDPVFTCEMAKEMARCASAMPADWWDGETHMQSANAKLAHEHLMAQMWFWEIQAFLHLPHMLRTDGEQGGAYQNQSRSLCLQGCREMLKVFCLLRGTPGLSVYICSCEDFQGVITAAMLLVGILLGVAHGWYHPSIESLDDDAAVLEEVKEIFRYRSNGQGGSISRQGLKVVETLESFLTGDQEEDGEGNEEVAPSRARSIILPYFGLITVESRVRPLKKAQPMEAAADGYQLGATTTTMVGGSDFDFTDHSATTIPSFSDYQYTDLEPSLFDQPTTQQQQQWQWQPSIDTSPSSGSHALSEDVFDKPLAPSGALPDTGWDPLLLGGGMVPFEAWDQFLYGGELSQEWDASLPSWQATFEEWNEAGAR